MPLRIQITVVSRRAAGSHSCGRTRSDHQRRYPPGKGWAALMTAPSNCHPGILVLDDCSAFIRRFVSLSQAQADLCALWIVHTHAIVATDFTPYLCIHVSMETRQLLTVPEFAVTLRLKPSCVQGYVRESFEEAWERYLDPPTQESPSEGQHALQSSIHAPLSAYFGTQQEPAVASQKNAKSTAFMHPVAAVAPSGAEKANGRGKCRVHPQNLSDWWMRGTDPVCGLCHPAQ